MQLLPDGAGYRAAYRDRQDAGELPPFDVRFPLITVTPDSVSLNDAAIERAIDAEVRAGSNGRYIADVVRAVLRAARQQRVEWLDGLGRWWTSHLMSSETAIVANTSTPADLDVWAKSAEPTAARILASYLINDRNVLSVRYWADTADQISRIDARLRDLLNVAAPAAVTPATGGPTHHGESTTEGREICGCSDPDCPKAHPW